MISVAMDPLQCLSMFLPLAACNYNIKATAGNQFFSNLAGKKKKLNKLYVWERICVYMMYLEKISALVSRMWPSLRKRDFLMNLSDSSMTCSGSTTSGIVSLLDFFKCTSGACLSSFMAVYNPILVEVATITKATQTGTKSPFFILFS